MLIARVIGTTVSTIKDEKLSGENCSSCARRMNAATRSVNLCGD